MEAISNVRIGMRVVDADGNEVGTVEDVKIGDPSAATAAGQRTGEQTLWSGVVETMTGSEPRVPEEQAEQLLRIGYIKIDGKGLFSGTFYAGSDGIRSVEGDSVHLDHVPDR